VRVSGERVSTSAGGFNPTWQRHVAAYAAAAELLPPGRVLDLGCGVGHSFALLAPRETVGVDLDAEALAGQERETIVADMREVPVPSASFASVLSVQSIEHVPDPERVVAEARRVLEPAGTAVFVTPNRLTFGPPDEIVDPYHHVELDESELRERLDRLLRRDPLRLRRLVPRRARQVAYDRMLRRARADGRPEEEAIDVSDFELRAGPLDDALDLVAICR
jgi:SAM-dependent methyltransferase